MGTPSTKRFDIFLSYKSGDAPIVERLKADLQRRGVRVWLDKDQIRPGDVFAEALEKGLATSKSVGLVATPKSLESKWVQSEYYRALSLANQGELQLIPLLYRKADLPGFLADRQHIDFRRSAEYERNVDRVIWPGITGKRIVFVAVHPGHGVPWSKLLRRVTARGVEFVEGQDIDRAGYKIQKLLSDGSCRVVPVVDIFEDWPKHQKWRRNTPEEYVKFVFELRKRTKDTENEVVFLLYHNSEAFESAEHSLGEATVKRLQHYFSLHQNVRVSELDKFLAPTWLRLQRDLLKSEQM